MTTSPPWTFRCPRTRWRSSTKGPTWPPNSRAGCWNGCQPNGWVWLIPLAAKSDCLVGHGDFIVSIERWSSRDQVAQPGGDNVLLGPRQRGDETGRQHAVDDDLFRGTRLVVEKSLLS